MFRHLQISNTWLDDFIHTIYPLQCNACGKMLVKYEDLICTHCRYHLPYTNFHLNPSDNALLIRLAGLSDIRLGMSMLYFQKEGRVQNILHNLKYNDTPQLGYLLGKWYGAKLTEHGFNLEFDAIIVIPLHKTKLKKRGYNQSEWIAKGLSEQMNIPIWEQALIKTKATQSQTRKSRKQRLLNIKDSFITNPKYDFESKRLLIIDDVLTTGATISTAIKVIQEKKCTDISVVTLAFAVES
jgi:ComF family protein